jgi:hypothetical protein
MNNPILATQASPIVKPTYQFASTASIIETLAVTGWKPVEQKVARVKSPERDGFQRHIVTLENAALPEIPGMTDDHRSRPRITVMNSHDAGTALRVILGFLRFACLNGILAGTGLREFRAVHSANLTEKLGDGIRYVAEDIPALTAQLQHLQSVQFSAANEQEFIRALVDARLQHVEAVDVDYNSAIQVRRFQDGGRDAFSVLNRVQESLMRGGIAYKRVVKQYDDQGNVTSQEIRPATTRKLSSIQQAVKLNRQAYDLAMKFAA